MPSLIFKIKAWYHKQRDYITQQNIKNGYKLHYLLGIISLGFYARLLFLFSYPTRDVWHDEAFQWVFSQKPLLYILSGTDVHPPLFNVIAKVLLFVSKDMFFLRYMMVFISLYFLYYAFLMMLKIFDEKTAYYGTVMLAVAPTFIYYATEFRVYSWALTIIVCQILAFNVMLKDHSLKNRAIYILFSLVAMYSHYLTGLIVFCQALYLFFFKTPVSDNMWSMIKQYWVKVYLPMFLGLLPLFYYLSLMLPQMTSFWFKNIGFHSLISAFAFMISPPLERTIGVVFLPFLGLLIGLIYFRKLLKPEHIQFMFYVVLPPVLMYIISLTTMKFFHPRYFIFSGVALLTLLAWVLSKWDDIEPEVGSCMVGFFVILCYFAFNGMVAVTNTELYESTIYLKNYTHANNITDFATVHTSQFSGTPYRYYFPDKKNFLLTNFTKIQRFTAGGSAIGDDQIVHDLSFINNISYPVFLVTDKISPTELTNIRGLHIARLK